MSVNCPCCKAVNDTGPACRRCKADLTTLFVVVARRDQLIAEAKRLGPSDPDGALEKLDEAEAYQAGTDLHRLRAAVHLLNRDFPAAWTCYRAGTATPPPGRER